MNTEFAKVLERLHYPLEASVDGCFSNLVALHDINAARKNGYYHSKNAISPHLNNLVEQDPRAVLRIVNPMGGFKSFHCAAII